MGNPTHRLYDTMQLREGCFFKRKFIRKRLRGKVWNWKFIKSAKEPLSSIALEEELELWKYQQFPKGCTVFHVYTKGQTSGSRTVGMVSRWTLGSLSSS